MANPVVRVASRDRAFFTSATMTVVAAITIGPPNCFRCAAGLCPRLFRRTGFNQKKPFIIPRAVVLLSYPSDHSVSDINRIKDHIAFVPIGEPYAMGKQSFLSHVCAPLSPCNNRSRVWRCRVHRDSLITRLRHTKVYWATQLSCSIR